MSSCTRCNTSWYKLAGNIGKGRTQLPRGQDFMYSKDFQNGYIDCMAKARTTSFVTPQQLKTLATQLATWSERLQIAGEIAEHQQPKGLAIYNWPSVAKGMQLLGSFVEKAEQSRMAAELGEPLSVGQPRTRSIRDDEPRSNVAEDGPRYKK